MKRNPSIERLFRWRFFSHEKTPKSVIPPSSAIRFIKREAHWNSDLKAGDELRAFDETDLHRQHRLVLEPL